MFEWNSGGAVNVGEQRLGGGDSVNFSTVDHHHMGYGATRSATVDVERELFKGSSIKHSRTNGNTHCDESLYSTTTTECHVTTPTATQGRPRELADTTFISAKSVLYSTPQSYKSSGTVSNDQLTAEDSCNPAHKGKDLFFALQDVDVESFKSDLPLSPRHGNHGNEKTNHMIHGKKVRVNGKELALFCYKDKFYAIDETCPHLGGPLHLGDIEDTPGSPSPCIVCPWHKWCFELSTGKRVRPLQGGESKSVETYPVRTDSLGKISVGFASLDSSCFDMSDF